MRILKFLLFLIFLFPITILAKSHISEVMDQKIPKKIKSESLRSKGSKVMKKKDNFFNEARLKIAKAKKTYPEIEALYDDTYNQAANLKESDKGETGTDLALKRLAAEFEKQFLTFMWQYAAGNVGAGENFANNVWSSEWRASIIEAGTEMGDIGMAVYEELRDIDSRKSKVARVK